MSSLTDIENLKNPKEGHYESPAIKVGQKYFYATYVPAYYYKYYSKWGKCNVWRNNGSGEYSLTKAAFPLTKVNGGIALHLDEKLNLDHGYSKSETTTTTTPASSSTSKYTEYTSFTVYTRSDGGLSLTYTATMSNASTSIDVKISVPSSLSNNVSDFTISHGTGGGCSLTTGSSSGSSYGGSSYGVNLYIGSTKIGSVTSKLGSHYSGESNTLYVYYNSSSGSWVTSTTKPSNNIVITTTTPAVTTTVTKNYYEDGDTKTYY